MVDNIIKYLKVTPPWKMFMHLVWLLCLLMILSSTYIITFHFQPVVTLIQRSQSLSYFSEHLQTSIAIDQQINALIQPLLSTSNASRSYVFRYHNGIPSVNNVPFMFHSMTHEWIKPGTSRVVMFSQRLPTGILGQQNADMIRRRCVAVNYLDRTPESIYGWHYYMRGAIAVVRCPFFSAQGDLLGFVGIDFNERISDSDLVSAVTTTLSASERLSIIFQNVARTN